MLIYNTLSGQKENLEKVMGGKRRLNLFVCGPTVYDYSHIGHARTYINFDIIVNYLKSIGYPLFYMQNITDIDDKIINRARQEKRRAQDVAKFFTKEYLKDMRALGIRSVDRYSPASKYIKEIKKQIQSLIERGYAYQTSSGIYFEVKKFSDYGKLSKQNLDALRPGWRIEPDPEKKDPLDFALWKFKKHEYEPSWPSPWGEGRPGWHIEDTAITEKHFSPQYDLHGGAIDLKFPHHESEIAQQEALSGKKPMVKIWLHTGFLVVGGEKMSKSLGNFITIRDFLKNSSSNVIRYIAASHHYRSPIDYTEKLVEQAKNSLKTVEEFLAKLALQSQKKTKDGQLQIEVGDYEKKIHAAMQDDFNTPQALAVIFDLINNTNPSIWSLDKKTAKELQKWLKKYMLTFGIAIKPAKIPLKIRRMARERELLRSNKQFTQADTLRKSIEALGYNIEDTPRGSLILKR